MNWAFKAPDVDYFQKRDRAPSHQTLKKHMKHRFLRRLVVQSCW
jgi:hypothetical protein